MPQMPGEPNLPLKRALPTGLALAFMATALLSAETGDPSAKLGLINQQIDKSVSRRKALRDELQALRLEEEEISGRRIDLAATIQGREAMISAGEKRLAALDERQETLRAHLSEKRLALTELLAGLQRLERNRPPPLATRPDDAVAAIRGAMLFGAVVPAVNRETAALTRTLAELATLKARREAEQEELRRHMARLDSAHKEMAGLQKRKVALIE
jgi:septal ring factor EnvC (AmiA/AmiB activator)